jgi:caffeoyl-CoA O-methyltransferase
VSHPSDAFTGIVHPEVKAYLASLAGADDPVLDAMEAYCAERRFPLIGRQTGRWLELLAGAIGARRVFEFGSGFGYSAFFFARAGAEVVGSEKDAHEHEAYVRFLAGHPLGGRIDIRTGDAFEIFDATTGSFDAALLDLHKQGYLAAYERAVPRLRPGGLLLADNVLWGGKTAREAHDDDTRALQSFNQRVFSDPRVQASILPVGDGLLVARIV